MSAFTPVVDDVTSGSVTGSNTAAAATGSSSSGRAASSSNNRATSSWSSTGDVHRRTATAATASPVQPVDLSNHQVSLQVFHPHDTMLAQY